MTVNPTLEPPRGHKSVMLAVLLQCIPLLFAGSCVTAAETGSDVTLTVGFLSAFSLFLPGLGYLYLGRRRGCLMPFIGVVMYFMAGLFNFNLGLNLIRCMDTNSAAERAQCYRLNPIHVTTDDRLRAWLTGLIVVLFVFYMALDAWRIARADNRLVEPIYGEQRIGRHSDQRVPLALIGWGAAVAGVALMLIGSGPGLVLAVAGTAILGVWAARYNKRW